MYNHISKRSVLVKACQEYELKRVHQVLRKCNDLSFYFMRVEFASYFKSIGLGELVKEDYYDYYILGALINYRGKASILDDLLLELKGYFKEKNPQYNTKVLKQLIKFLSLPYELKMDIFNCYDYLEINKYVDNCNPVTVYDGLWQEIITLPD